MIPLSLSLRNFLSYGESVPTLDFTAFHVACISGRNGHGKSALLDAMTWALWGEARKATTDRTPNDGLLRIGATEMNVVFEFDLEGERYRVSRSYRKTGKSNTSTLELQIFSPDIGDFRTLSEGGSVRKTQERLNALLRMNYDTFINSAFLLQGRADEFTRKGARERKATLGEILGLSRYDDLATLARSYAQTAEVERAKAQDKLSEIETASAQKKELQQGLKSVSEELKTLEKNISDLESRIETLRETQAHFERHRGERNSLVEEMTRLEADLKTAREQTDAIGKEVTYSQEILKEKETILANFEQHRTLQTKANRFQETLEVLRPLEQHKTDLEKEIIEARHEVERRLGEWNMRVSDTKKEQAEAEALLQNREHIEEKRKALQEARDQFNLLEKDRDKDELIKSNIRDLERQVEAASSALQVNLKAARERQNQLESLAKEHDTRQQALQVVSQQIEESRELEKDRDRIREAGSTLKSRIETGQGRLQDLQKNCQEIAIQRSALQDLQEAHCPLCGSELDDQHRTEVDQNLGEKDRDKQQEIAQLEAELTTAQAAREQHRRQYQEIKNKLTGLEQASKKAAPLEAAFQEAQKAVEELLDLKEKGTDLENQIRDLQTNSPDARALSEARQELETLSYDPAKHRALRDRIGELETVETQKAHLSAAEERREKAAQILPKYLEKQALAQAWLTEKRYGQPAQEALEKCLQKIQSLAYDSEQHQGVRQQLGRLKDAPEQYDRLQAAEKEMAGAQARLDAAQSRRQDLENRLKGNRERISELERILEQGKAGAKEVQELQADVQKKRALRDSLLQERATLETRFKECEAREATRSEEQDRFKNAEKEIQIYQKLSTAFGKDGIQALIIEQAIPEIEEEANRILAQLTDNRTQIALSSLRDLKKGGTRETLDIRISDELGDRNYELYSGGEAFRVDFAIRIALSKLLASRTGTRLRTLVIDEGFGTQDAEGLDQLVEAIQAISADFEKILVITHVESLKQFFPVRIEVTKYPDTGSRFEVIY